MSFNSIFTLNKLAFCMISYFGLYCKWVKMIDGLLFRYPKLQFKCTTVCRIKRQGWQLNYKSKCSQRDETIYSQWTSEELWLPAALNILIRNLGKKKKD